MIRDEKSISQTEEIRKLFQAGHPFPHVVVNDFLDEDAASQASKEFPKLDEPGWIHYVHFNERKQGLNKMELLPSIHQRIINELQSDAFVNWLEQVTGIENLLVDPTLEGGGLHQSGPGGFLNVHADFTYHPHRPNWRRRINLLIYFNENWQTEYGGEIEFWSADMKRCQTKISPIMNRAVIFRTDRTSFHGFPDPITSPEGKTRKSLALYYFTEEDDFIKETTAYRARPSDGLRSVLIWLDRKMVGIYTRIKGAFGINDDLISKILRWFNR